MAKTKDENGDGGKTENFDPNALMVQLMAKLVENQPTKVITEDSPEYQERLRAEGYYDTFPKPVFQNGRDAEARGLSAEVRERAASLRPGTYIGGKVTVEQAPGGGVHIKYKSRTVEDRMAQTWRDFSELVNRIWSEMHVTA